jgi:hypothetical protein
LQDDHAWGRCKSIVLFDVGRGGVGQCGWSEGQRHRDRRQGGRGRGDRARLAEQEQGWAKSADLLDGPSGDRLLVDGDEGVAQQQQSISWPLAGATRRPRSCHRAGWEGAVQVGELGVACGVCYPAEQAGNHDRRLVGCFLNTDSCQTIMISNQCDLLSNMLLRKLG